MADFDINLLGKRYPELNPTTELANDTIFAVYKTGQPELNRITFLDYQKNTDLKNVKDFIGSPLTNTTFPRWSTSLGKFVLGSVVLDDIPDLDASKIVSGVFPEARIPNLPISRIIGLQDELDSKEPTFLKGNVVSSTLALTGNIGRLYGSGDLGIEISTAVFESLFIPATRTITFHSSSETVWINGLFTYVKDLNDPDQEIDLELNYIPYVHPTGYLNQPNAGPLIGANIISQILVNDEGHTVGIETRELTKADIGLDQVDNTSDLDKPISTATQAAIDALDDRFLRKDADDNNGLFTLTLGNLTVNTAVVFGGLMDEISPDYGLAVMVDGTVRRTEIITPADISNLQDQIDNLQIQINNIVQDKNFEHIQSVPSTVWTAVHGLGKRPAVNVWDSSGNPIISYEVLINDGTTFSIELSAAIVGRIDFN